MSVVCSVAGWVLILAAVGTLAAAIAVRLIAKHGPDFVEMSGRQRTRATLAAGGFCVGVLVVAGAYVATLFAC